MYSEIKEKIHSDSAKIRGKTNAQIYDMCVKKWLFFKSPNYMSEKYFVNSKSRYIF